MIDDPVFFPGIYNFCRINPANISVLASPFREKCRLIQDHPVSFTILFTGNNLCLELFPVTVPIE